MSEETWYKMLAVSFALHILVVASFSIPFKSTKRKIDLSSSYSGKPCGWNRRRWGCSSTQKVASMQEQKYPWNPFLQRRKLNQFLSKTNPFR